MAAPDCRHSSCSVARIQPSIRAPCVLAWRPPGRAISWPRFRDRPLDMEILELPPGDERLAAVYPVMNELRTRLSEDEFHQRYVAGHVDGYRIAAVFDCAECR